MKDGIYIPHGVIIGLPTFSAGLIDESITLYEKITGIMKSVGQKYIHASFVNNLKDAFMHFKQMFRLLNAITSEEDGTSRLNIRATSDRVFA